MKAEFLKYGHLVITPENDLENYALSKWHDAYKNHAGLNQCESVLMINNFVIDRTAIGQKQRSIDD